MKYSITIKIPKIESACLLGLENDSAEEMHSYVESVLDDAYLLPNDTEIEVEQL